MFALEERERGEREGVKERERSTLNDITSIYVFVYAYIFICDVAIKCSVSLN